MAQDTFSSPVITASGLTWAQYKTGGLAGQLAGLIATNLAKANPTVAATAAGSVAVGTLPAGTYFFNYTFVDAFGETAAVAAGESVQFTGTGLAQLCTVTLPANPTGVHAKNLYVTPTNGAAGSEVLYASGITGTTFACNVTFPAQQSAASVGIPTINTSGADKHTRQVNALLLGFDTDGTLDRISQDLSNYLSGYGISRQEIVSNHMLWLGVTKLWFTALSEINTLIIANMPTAFSTAVTAIGMPVNRWTLP